MVKQKAVGSVFCLGVEPVQGSASRSAPRFCSRQVWPPLAGAGLVQ